MARRWRGNMKGERYLGDISKKTVHDLDYEKTGPNECQIDEIVDARNDQPLNSLPSAHAAGYANCQYCMGGPTR